ncbi:hypothetical protein WME99_07620 [Sorangium sp. So ce136]|uniref:hypothetical protein n=1 Tax=Sorangium sp. So ce136 TaxID=3133284 RepID=UPI003EFFB117
MPLDGSSRRPPDAPPEVERAAVLAELDQVIGSSAFGGSARQARLLRFLVGEVLDGRGGGLRAPLVATRVFDRPEGFDSCEDSIVRVEMSKLRRALARHYAATRAAVVRIELPRGTYAPSFVPARETPAPEAARSALQSGEFTAGAAGPVLAVLPFAGVTIVSSTALRAPTAGEAAPPDPGVPGARSQAFALGLTDRVGALFASSPWASMVSRASSLEDAKARGARYVIEGSVRFVAQTVRVTANLHDAARGTQVWGSTYDRAAADDLFFAAEDAIAHEIAVQLLALPLGAVHAIEAHERAGHPAQGAYDAVLRFPRWLATFDRRLQAEILDVCERALVADPDQGMLLAFLSIFHGLSSWTAEGSSHDRRRAADLARHAVALEPTLAVPHNALALVLLDAGDGPGALAEAETALAIGGDPATSGFLTALAGAWDRGNAVLRAHLRLMKRPPGCFHHALSLDAYRRGDHAAALAAAEAIATPNLAWDPLDRAVALARLGRIPEARAAGRALTVILPDISRDPHAVVARLTADARLVDDLVEGLRLAGVG